jgi:hypothetical protein
VRAAVEDRTDVLALPPWERLARSAARGCGELVRPLSRPSVAAGGLDPLAPP